jgi:hypothetical protein
VGHADRCTGRPATLVARVVGQAASPWSVVARPQARAAGRYLVGRVGIHRSGTGLGQTEWAVEEFPGCLASRSGRQSDGPSRTGDQIRDDLLFKGPDGLRWLGIQNYERR